MNVMPFILLAVAAAIVVASALLQLRNVVKGDGYGRRSGQRTPPLSHVPDPFDPRSRMA